MVTSVAQTLVKDVQPQSLLHFPASYARLAIQDRLIAKLAPFQPRIALHALILTMDFLTMSVKRFRNGVQMDNSLILHYFSALLVSSLVTLVLLQLHVTTA